MSYKRKLPLRVFALLTVLAMVLAACGSDKKSGTKNNSTDTTASGTAAGAQKKGGKLVFVAEQWPDCINPLTQCANSSWLQWLVPIHVLPRLAEIDAKGAFVASPLLDEYPSIENKGLQTEPDFSVTYHLNKDANWDDGTPITADDVEFTWHAYLDTTGSLSTTGYDQISKIDKPDPKTAVVTFKQKYTDWPDVFGGFSGVVLQKSKFASTNVASDMQNSIPFSGGPWKITEFSKDQEVLVANTSYWDKERIPFLDQVTFVPRTDTNTEVQEVKSGVAAVAYPQPAADNVPLLKTGGNLKTTFGNTTQYENIWWEEKEPSPFTDKNLRLTMAYAFDRQKLIDVIVKPFSPNVKMLQCSSWIPGLGDWCDNTLYSDIKPDPKMVEKYMKASGYEKNSAGIWAKDGKALQIKWKANSGNQRREDAQALMIPELKKQGFDIVTDNVDSDTLFQQDLPAGNFEMAMFIQVTSPDPTVKTTFHTDQIPGPANNGAGQNDWWYSNPKVDKLIDQADQEFDIKKRADLTHQIGKLIREDMVTLPMYVFPAMVSWRTDRIEGPIDEYINNPESVYFNMYDWSAK